MGFHSRGHHRAQASRKATPRSENCSSTPPSTTCRRASTCSMRPAVWWSATSAICRCTACRRDDVKPGCTRARAGAGPHRERHVLPAIRALHGRAAGGDDARGRTARRWNCRTAASSPSSASRRPTATVGSSPMKTSPSAARPRWSATAARRFAHIVIENMPATIMVKDARTLRYVLVNRAGEQYLRHPARADDRQAPPRSVFIKEIAATIAKHDREMLDDRRAAILRRAPGDDARRHAASPRPPDADPGCARPAAISAEPHRGRTDRKRAEAQIAHLAHHDPLTDLPNRAAFNDLLDATIETRRQRRPIVRAAVPRPRPLQGGQRRLRPCGRRRAAARGRRRLQRGGRRRVPGAPRRRRVRADRRPTARSPPAAEALAERLLAAIGERDSRSTASSCASG